MSETLLGRVWAWLHETFPERQVYIRSNGRVQFFIFGPSLQATLAGLMLILLGWMAFATVNVVFKDRIIAAKDHRYRQMQTAYENRVADLQISYDALNGALVAAENQFKSVADLLQNKQTALAGVINRERAIQASAGKVLAAPPQTRLDFNGDGAIPEDDGVAGDSVGMEAPLGNGDPVAATGPPRLFVLPRPAVPQPRAAKPAKSSLLQRAWTRVSALFAPLPAPAAFGEAALVQHPRLRILARETERVRQAGMAEMLLLARTEDNLEQGVGNLRNLIRRAGINPDRFSSRVTEGMGGPEIPINRVRIPGISDSRFTQAYLRAAAMLDRLGVLARAVGRFPLSVPVSEDKFDRTSGFGPRLDPFTGRIAFHPGIDFAGPWGSAVHSTAPGTVVFAGNRGGYGNMIEIDHGNGIHTRYGHLSAVTVRAGMHVGRGNAIGRVGSTGRSTGPHVHYEVWYDDVVRNPSNFIEAGRHVLQ